MNSSSNDVAATYGVGDTGATWAGLLSLARSSREPRKLSISRCARVAISAGSLPRRAPRSPRAAGSQTVDISGRLGIATAESACAANAASTGSAAISGCSRAMVRAGICRPVPARTTDPSRPAIAPTRLMTESVEASEWAARNSASTVRYGCSRSPVRSSIGSGATV